MKTATVHKIFDFIEQSGLNELTLNKIDNIMLYEELHSWLVRRSKHNKRHIHGESNINSWSFVRENIKLTFKLI